MSHKMIQLFTICGIVLTLFFFASGNALAAQAPTKSTSTAKGNNFSAQIQLSKPQKSTSGIQPAGIPIGSICVVNTYSYEVSSGVLGGTASTSCSSVVAVIDTQIKFEYCTSAFSGSTFCLGSWQVKSYGVYCATGPTTSQNCPPGGDDDYHTGTNALWAFVASVCVEFANGSVDCGDAGNQVWMS